ncbi:two-component system sensor histidine kinase ComP [Paenibacillus pabuli]|uniref:histidine kinase n=1 Tax=Paenibacillus pabuli TaxID=1472 RepID=A0ABX9BJF0_9BACL|nr:ATP-binding protein [Paenibacillus pabuli]RAI94661.1 two-component system sensor histidine kinase ComP [Paenibacillus pabuli]
MRKRNWLAAVLIYIVIVIYDIVLLVGTPLVHIEVEEEDVTGNYKVISVGDEGWGQAYMKPGDIVTAIDGASPVSNFTVQHYGKIERADSITRLGADGNEQLLTIQKLPLHVSLLSIIGPLSASILFLFFVLVMGRYRMKDSSAFLLALFFLFTVLAYLGGYTTDRYEPFGRLFFYVSFLMVPILFIHFMNSYLRKFEECFVSKPWLVFFYICIVFHIVMRSIRELVDVEFYAYGSILLILFFAIPNILIVAKLIQQYRKHRLDHLRSLFKLTLIAHTLAFFPFVCLYSLPSLFDYPIVSNDVAAAFLLTLPIIYLYMLMTRMLFDVDFIVNRFIYHALLAIVPSALMAILGMWVARSGGQNGIEGIRMFLLFYFLLVITLFVKESMDRRVKNKLNGRLDISDSFERFSHKVSRVMKCSDLEKVLEQEINSSLPVLDMAFFDLDIHQTEVKIDKLRMTERAEMASVLRKKMNLLAPGNLLTMSRGICLVIGKRQDSLYILWVDDKANHTRFNPDERNWLSTLANYSAIVYENLYLIEEIIVDLETEIQKHSHAPSWVLRLIFNLSENERRRLASDLHDSALQDQIIWLRRLETTIIDEKMSDGLRAELEQIREGLLDVIHQIRETCNELRPPLLMEMGLTQALEQLFVEAQTRTDYVVNFSTESIDGLLGDEQTLAIYRITQELLRNAAKHARASRVEIAIRLEEGILHYTYSDNGVGMEWSVAEDSFSHMGISGIKERVRSFEGSFDWHSQLGKGLFAVIRLPIRS